MRVVIATPFYPPERGVLAVYAAGIKGALPKQGHTVTVVSFGFLKYLPTGLRHGAYWLKVLFPIMRADHVLILDTWSVGVPAGLAARICRKPYSIRIGGDALWEAYIERTRKSIRLSDFYTAPRALSLKEKFMRRLMQSLVKHAHAVFFNTVFQKNIWERAYSLPKNTHVVENFFPPKQEGTPPRGHVFVAANRPTAYKNQDMLERVCARVREQYPDVVLDTRILSHEEHLQRLRDAYATIIPSVSEVGSNIAIESVSRGKPFIMTEDTGTHERLSGCGIFIDTRSEQALQGAIESLLDKTTYASYQERIRTFSFVRSWDDVVADILTHI